MTVLVLLHFNRYAEFVTFCSLRLVRYVSCVTIRSLVTFVSYVLFVS